MVMMGSAALVVTALVGLGLWLGWDGWFCMA